jgi:hypothetical protein
MMYDDGHLYIAAHVGDPEPMRSVIDPAIARLHRMSIGTIAGDAQVGILANDLVPVSLAVCSDRGELLLWRLLLLRRAHPDVCRDTHGNHPSLVGLAGTVRRDSNSFAACCEATESVR